MSDKQITGTAPKLGVVAGSVSVGLIGLDLSTLPGITGALSIQAKRYEPKPYVMDRNGVTMRCRTCNGYWPDRCKCPKPNSQNH